MVTPPPGLKNLQQKETLHSTQNSAQQSPSPFRVDDILSTPSPKGKLNPIFIFKGSPVLLIFSYENWMKKVKKINNLNMKVIKLS